MEIKVEATGSGMSGKSYALNKIRETLEGIGFTVKPEHVDSQRHDPHALVAHRPDEWVKENIVPRY